MDKRNNKRGFRGEEVSQIGEGIRIIVTSWQWLYNGNSLKWFYLTHAHQLMCVWQCESNDLEISN